jgi:hypothetical protein
MTKIDTLGAKHSMYDKVLLELLASSFIPFNVVDSEAFNLFMRELDRTINLKTSRTYSRQMEKFALDVLEDVKEAVNSFLTNARQSITTQRSFLLPMTQGGTPWAM